MNTNLITRSDDLRAQNRHRILQTLRKHGDLTRAQIGKHTELSQAALSKQLSLMAEQGLVISENNDTTEQKRGRPKTRISLNPKACIAVTAALTIDAFQFSIIDYAGNLIVRTDTPLKSCELSENQIIRFVTEGISDILKPYSTENLQVISISFQGVTDATNGDLLWSPSFPIRNIGIGKIIENKFKVAVTVHNDCSLIANALHHSEHEQLGESFAAVLFSHGIGLGVYLDGKPFRAAQSSGLELGHIVYEKDGALCRCGNLGCIEAYAADYGIARSAQQLDPHTKPKSTVSEKEFNELIEAVHKQKSNEVDAFKLAGHSVGFGLATLCALFGTLPIALVGHNTRALDIMSDEIQDALTTASRGSTFDAPPVISFYDDSPLVHQGLTLVAMRIIDYAYSVSNLNTPTSLEPLGLKIVEAETS